MCRDRNSGEGPIGNVGFKLPAAAEPIWVSLARLRTKI